MQENTIKISLITPSFNQGQFIEQTISSVIEQGYPDLEYIVMDGGSKDNTLDIVKKYQQHFSHWSSEKDNGQSNAINKGLEKATGDIVNWLNSDDHYEPGTLQHVGKIFSDENVMGYSGISRIFGGKKEYFSKGTDIYPGNLHKTIGWARIDQPETFFRRSALEAIGHLNENLHYVMDRDLWIRYLCKFGLKGFVKDEKLLVHFRLHDDSKTVLQKKEFNAEQRSLYFTYADIYGLTDQKKFFSDLFTVNILPLNYYSKDLSADDWKKIINYYLLREGLEAYAQNNYDLAASVLKRVKKEWITKAEYDQLFTVQMRIKLLPPGIKKIWNKIRS